MWNGDIHKNGKMRSVAAFEIEFVFAYMLNSPRIWIWKDTNAYKKIRVQISKTERLTNISIAFHRIYVCGYMDKEPTVQNLKLEVKETDKFGTLSQKLLYFTAEMSWVCN